MLSWRTSSIERVDGDLLDPDTATRPHSTQVGGDRHEHLVGDRERRLVVEKLPVVAVGLGMSVGGAQRPEELTVATHTNGMRPLLPRHTRHRASGTCEWRKSVAPYPDQSILLRRRRDREALAAHSDHDRHRPRAPIGNHADRSILHPKRSGDIEQFETGKRWWQVVDAGGRQ